MEVDKEIFVSYFKDKIKEINDILISYDFVFDEQLNSYKKQGCSISIFYEDNNVIPKGISITYVCVDENDEMCFGRTIYTACRFCSYCLLRFLTENKIIKLRKINIFNT